MSHVKKVDAAALKLAAQNYELDIIMDAALEIEWLRNKVGQQRNTIKKKQHVIDTVNHHNNRLSNDSRAAHYALGHKFMEVDKLKKALEFYADENNHNQKNRSPFNSEYYYSDVMEDFGEIARKALEELLNG